MSTLITPHRAGGTVPDDDDPTGVRAMLSGLPEPEPMPAYLVERINASLAAEQAQRAVTSHNPPVTPIHAIGRRRTGRFVFAVAGAAAAVALVAVVSDNLGNTGQATSAADTAGAAPKSAPREADGAAPPSVEGKGAAGGLSAPTSVEVRLSGVRYTEADFARQTQRLSAATFDLSAPTAASSAGVGTLGTVAGLAGCLGAIGEGGAQVVRADVALYDGQPAVIIVATTDGRATAYAVGPACSRTNATLLHPATPLP